MKEVKRQEVRSKEDVKKQDVEDKAKGGKLFYLSYFIFLTASLFLTSCLFASSSNPTSQVCFKGQCVDVEVARKPQELQRGLQHRKSMQQNHGMLFIFNNNRKHSFWMKDTFISLDMIWLNYARRVVHIESHVPPCKKDPCPTYAPEEDSLYVLEVNAGYTETLGVGLGDIAEFIIN